MSLMLGALLADFPTPTILHAGLCLFLHLMGNAGVPVLATKPSDFPEEGREPDFENTKMVSIIL
jgi:hypothetical protein